MTHLDNRSERGAVLVFTALALTVLAGFLVFVIDQGILMVARGQAQDAADAAALAGATALVFDEVVSLPVEGAGGASQQAAEHTALANPVWNQPGVAKVSFVGAGPGTGCSGPTGSCVRVNVYRDGDPGNGSAPLPTIFGGILGITSQRVKAMAIAEAAPSNATECVRAFALPYSALSVAVGYGTRFDSGIPPDMPPLRPGAPPMPGVPGEVGVGKYQLVDVWSGGPANVRLCPTDVHGIDDVFPVLALNSAEVVDAVLDLIALDPGASWNDATLHVEGSCVGTHTCQKYDSAGNLVADPDATVSPRVIVLPLFDPMEFQASDIIRVVNHIGLFLTDATLDMATVQPRITGVVVTALGIIKDPEPAIPLLYDFAFLRTIRLVR